MASSYQTQTGSSHRETTGHQETRQTGGQNSWGVSKSTQATQQEGGSTSSTVGAQAGVSTGKTAATGEVDARTKANYQNAQKKYEQSEAVKAAYNQLQETLNNKPGAFSSKYTANLENLYSQIMDRPSFSYNMNNDAMYNIYKDMYTQQGKSAMRDTVAQSAALTGGYNNSYATTAGSQAYQSYLERLNEIVPQLQQNAYNMYQDKTNQLYNKANLTQSLYQQDYGQYRDKVSDWQKDRDYLTNYYNNERNFDYGMYNNDRNFSAQEYWNQRNAEKTNTNQSFSTSQSDTNARNWSNSFTTGESANWNTSENWSNSTTDSHQVTDQTTSKITSGYTSGSGGSGGSGGSSRSNSGGGESARSGKTLDKGQRDTITMNALNIMQQGGDYKAYLQGLVSSGEITYGDYNYMVGDDDYKRKSDAAYVKARG